MVAVNVGDTAVACCWVELFQSLKELLIIYASSAYKNILSTLTLQPQVPLKDQDTCLIWNEDPLEYKNKSQNL